MQISVKLRPSKLLAVILTIAHVGAIICVWFIGLPILALILTLLIIFSYYYSLTKYALLRHVSSITKVWHQDSSWHLQTKAGQIIAAQLQHKFISRYLVILNFKALNKRFAVPVIIGSDMLDVGKFKQLRRCLVAGIT